MPFELVSEYKPAGDQPQAIAKLVQGVEKGGKQTLLGVTGSGKSLDYDELIFVRDENGKIVKEKIGRFVEGLLKRPKRVGETEYESAHGWKILSFSPKTNKIEEKEIIEISRHKENRIYEIVLDDGSHVKATGDHNFFRFKDATFELCRTTDLTIGDVLPASNYFPKPSAPLKSINLLKYATETKLSIDELIKAYDADHEKILSALDGFRAPKWKLTQVLQRTSERGVTVPELYSYLDRLGIGLDEAAKHVRIVGKKGDVLPPIIPLSQELLTFIGLYISEGHGERKDVIISNSNAALQEGCMSVFRQLGLSWNRRNENDVQYNSHVMAAFFCSFGTTARKKHIPSEFYNLSDEQSAIMLRAVFDGDGYVEANSAALTSASLELVNDLRNLLLRFGITTRVRSKRVEKETYWILSIAGRDNLKKFESKISFSLGYKREKLHSIIKEDANTNVDLVYNSSSFIKSFRITHGILQRDLAKALGCNRSYISMVEHGERSPSKRIFSRLIAFMGTFDSKYRALHNILDFNLRKVVSITPAAPKNGFVYDLSVAENENFMAGYGNIFVHNTFSIANVIAKTGKKTIIISHNKTLAAQLYGELRQFFPKNKVGYFVSYYDYYQPESYIPSTDTYIEKDVDVNEKIEQMRIAASASLLSRDDVIIVATVSAIYGLVSPKDYMDMSYELRVGEKITRQKLLKTLIQMQYQRSEYDLIPGKFRAKGDTIDVFPMYNTGAYIRISLFGDEIESISERDCINNNQISTTPFLRVFPAKLFVIPQERINKSLDGIRAELAERLPQLSELERHRLKQRTEYDLEMLKNTGHCNGIENYSRYMDVRDPGMPPHCLLDFFGDDFLIVVDESHITLPQITGMQKGDHARKKNLIDYGFRLPSAYDNRPLTFTEFEKYTKNVIFVSATPADYEFEHSEAIVEQLVRPTGLLDPKPEVRPTIGQVDDLVRELKALEKKGWRAFVTTLTKRMAEDLTDYLVKEGIKARYLHSEIETLERTDILRRLRLGEFQVLVGINLLREGLDIPEVALVAVFDADKEGFLRNARSLIQVFGRAARNVDGKVIMYADRVTDSMKKAMEETMRRREIQEKYNTEHGITPKTIIKAVEQGEAEIGQTRNYAKSELARVIIDTEAAMKNAADEMDFENAIMLRDKLASLRKQMGQKVRDADYQKKKIEDKAEAKIAAKEAAKSARKKETK